MLEPHGVIVFGHEGEDLRGLARRRDPGFLSSLDALAKERPIGVVDIDTRNRAIGAKSHMIFAANIDGVLDVTDQILRMRLPRFSQEGHEVNPCNPAAVGQCFEFRIPGIAWQIHECPAAGVGDCHGRFRCSDALGNGARAGMAQIQQQVQSVHFCDEVVSHFAQAAIRLFHAAVAHEIARVVSRLHDPNSEVRKYRQFREITLEHGGVLAAVDDSEPPRRLRRLKIGSTQNLHEKIRMRRQFMLHFRNVRDRTHEFVRTIAHIVDGQIDGGHAGFPDVRQPARRQRRIVRGGGINLADAAQGIDDHGVLISRPRKFARPLAGK
jgi:hypothetical protein